MKSKHILRRVVGFMVIPAMFAVSNVSDAASNARFTDLQRASWAESGIYYLADRGTVAGYGGGAFKPLDPITRAQAVTYLVRELYARDTPSIEAGFRDVPGNHSFYREIAIASEKGLAGGMPDGSFRPDEPISRAETAAMLTRAYRLAVGRVQTEFSDIDRHWAAEPIRLLVSNGLAGGYPDRTFKPNRAVNRAEFAVFLTRVIQFKRAQAIDSRDWDSFLALMTLEEKAGQMLMPDIRMWQNKPTTSVNAGITGTVKDHRLGGLILFEKNITDVAQLTTLNYELQRLAGDIPLFLGIDQEGGVIKRIPGGTNLPGAMALGAAGDTSLSFEAGKLTGAELKALGINLNFAPVLDVNVNPDNPIIGIRSFGADAGLVTDMGTAFMKGLQQQGIIAAAKHFPGHGDTAVDSHLGLPVVPHDRERLEQVELLPFREAIRQGVDIVMTAHVAFPAIENETVRSKKDCSNVILPATLSKKVVTGLLREELGFQGIVISDAFTMNAIAEHFGEEEATVRAVAAGVDIILMPQNISGAFDSIVRAVENGKLEERQIDDAVKRILQLKHKFGLFDRTATLQTKLDDAKQLVGSRPHLDMERRIAEKAVTMLTENRGQLHLPVEEGDVIAVVAPNPDQAQLFERGLSELGIPGRFRVVTMVHGEASDEELAVATSEADLVIAASYQFRSALELHDWSGYQALIDTLNKQSKRYVLVSLGNPYELMFLREVETAIAVYGPQEPNIYAGLRAIFGFLEPRGTLPLKIGIP